MHRKLIGPLGTRWTELQHCLRLLSSKPCTQNNWHPVELQRTFDVADCRGLYTCGRSVHCDDQTKLLNFSSGHTQPGMMRRANVWWGSSSSAKVTDWNRAVSEAEKIVGYSTSFLSLRCLLSDELSNVAMQMRKLVGTGHPLLKTARKLFYDGKHNMHNMQTRGLLVLLTAKAAGPGMKPHEDDCPEAMVGGIYPSQRSLAEIVEMIHTAGLIHKGIVNISAVVDDDSSLVITDSQTDDFKFGNKMAVLSGDFLLANASTGLAALNNTQVVEIISASIGHMMQAEFTALRDCHGNAVLPVDGLTMADWERQTFLATGSLISSSCKAALMLAQHPDSLQEQAYEFGKQIALAYQLNEELTQILNGDWSMNGNGVSVTSAPVILYINSPRCSVSREELAVIDDRLLKRLRKLIVQDSSVLAEARRLCDVYGQNAVDALQCFTKSDARNALQNIVQATTSF